MDSGCVIIALLDSENNNCADVASASSLNNPNTVEPLPDRLANLALQSSNLLLITPISGYVEKTIFSKSFSKS